MGKTGWQVTAFALGLGFIGAGFGALANRSALQQERNDAQPCQTITHEVDAAVIQPKPQEAPKRYGRMDWPDNVRCQGGVLLIHTEHGFESLLKKGRAMPCEENPWR